MTPKQLVLVCCDYYVCAITLLPFRRLFYYDVVKKGFESKIVLVMWLSLEIFTKICKSLG